MSRQGRGGWPRRSGIGRRSSRAKAGEERAVRRKVGVQRAPHVGVDAVHGDDEEGAVGEGEAVPVLGGVEGDQ